MSEINYTIRTMQELKTMVKRKDFGYTRAIDSSIQALREKAELEKGCEGCQADAFCKQRHWAKETYEPCQTCVRIAKDHYRKLVQK